MKLYAQLFKVDEEKRLVFGRAVQEVPDKSGEIFDYATSKVHFQDWSESVKKDSGGLSLGNVRAMHGKVAAGKLQAIHFNDAEKAIDVEAKIVDDSEWKKVLEGVYSGFSIGGTYIKKWADEVNKDIQRYTAAPTELSLVDRPCIPTSTFFSVQKADGSLIQVEFAKAADTSADDKKEKTMDDKKERPEPKDKKSPAEDDGAEVGADGKPKKKMEGVDTKKMPAKEDEDTEKMDTVYEVRGSPEDVQALADLMGKANLEVADVLVEMTKVLAAKATSVALDTRVTAMLAKEASGDLKKGMYAVSRLASILGDVDSLCDSVAYDQVQATNYKSVLPDKMLAVVSAMVMALRQMVLDETSEILGEHDASRAPERLMLSEAIEGLSKAGSRNSTQDQTRIDTICRLAVELGAKYEMKEAADTASELEKMNGAKTDAEKEVIQKAVSDQVEKLTATLVAEKQVLQKRLDEILARPAPPRGVLKAITKGQDLEGFEKTVPVEPVKGASGVENEAATLIKGLHKTGGVPIQTLTNLPPIAPK